jgi:dipeptidase E
MNSGGFSMETRNPLLDDFIRGLTRKPRPKVCFVPTASGDGDNYIARFYRSFDASRCSRSHLPLFHGGLPELAKFLCEQDVIYGSGGNTANMLAVWRVHAMDKALSVAWRKGVVLCGVSAGGMCWFEAGITNSFGSRVAPLRNRLGFLKGAFYPHYNGEPERRPALHRALRHAFPPALAVDDGVGCISSATDLGRRFLRVRKRMLTAFVGPTGKRSRIRYRRNILAPNDSGGAARKLLARLSQLRLNEPPPSDILCSVLRKD